MITPFSSSSTGSLSLSTFAAKRLYFRSTAAETSSTTLTITGIGSDGTTLAYEGVAVSSGDGQVEAPTSATYTKLLAVRNGVAWTGEVKVYAEGTAGRGLVYLTGQPSDGDTVTVGLTGRTQAYRFKTTTAAAYDVKIGATANDTASNLKKALNADGLGDGTDYHTGTSANPYLSATVSGAICTVTDRIGCSRQIAWSFAKSGTNISTSVPAGGVDGVLLATLPATQQGVFSAVTLDDEALDQNRLPGYTEWTSDPIRVRGKAFSLHIGAGTVGAGTPVEAELSYSTQEIPTVWLTSPSTIADLDNNRQIITPSDRVEYIRLTLNNDNGFPVSVNAKLVGE